MPPVSARGRDLALRLAGIAGAALFAAAAIAAAADRLSVNRPPWERLVPALFADNAWRIRGLVALRGGDAAGALVAARAAVRSGPVEPGSAELLGAALLLARQPEAADRAYRIAGRTGWRRPDTQAYLLNRSLALADDRTAARWLDAALRLDPRRAGDAALMGPFERDPRARAALAQRLAANPPWREAYARNIATLPATQLRLRGEILRSLYRRSGPGGCAVVGGLVSALVEQGLAGDADALWRAGCPGQGAGPLGDGTFSGADLARRDSLFSWWAPADSDVSTFVDDRAPPGSPRLAVASTSPFVRAVVSRMVYLPAGGYRLQWQAITADGQASDRITALLACREGIGSPVPATIDPRDGTASAEVAVDGACPARWLSFRIAPGPGEVRFGNVRLAAVSAGRGP